MLPTDNLALPPPTIARLDKCRGQVALFFKWIEQHPRIKRFFGTAENAVKTRVRIAISVYVPIAIIKKRRDIDASLTQPCRFQASRRSRKHRSVRCSARTSARRIATHSISN